MRDTVKILVYIHFEVAIVFATEGNRTRQAGVKPLAFSAGIRIIYLPRLKVWLAYVHHGMLHHPLSECSSAYHPLLRVEHREIRVRTKSVVACHQRIVYFMQPVIKIFAKSLYSSFAGLPFLCLVERKAQILWITDSII